MTRHSRLSAPLVRGLLWAALLAPVTLQLALLPQYGRLQRDDYYGVLRQVFADDGRPAEPGAWWRAHINYHRVAVPALIWGANVALFDGHNLPTSLLGLACLAAIALLLARRMPAAAPADGPGSVPGGRAPPGAWLLPAAIASVVMLQPIVAQNVARSFSAIHTYLAALFAVTVMVVLWRRAAPDPGPIWPLWPLAVLGPLTFSSELVTWPVAVAGALLLRLRGRDLAAVVGAAALAAATYLAGRPPPVPAALPEPGLLCGFLGVFLGAPFSRELATARGVGWSLLALGAAAQALAFARTADRRLPAFWAMVMLYGAGNGVLAALGRASRFGETGALAARYTIYPTLFLLATAATLICVARRRERATWAVAAALVVALIPVYRWGLRVMEIAIDEGRRQPLAELALRLGVEDPRYLSLASSNERYLLSTVPLLEALGHVPFDRTELRLPGPIVLGPAEVAEREPGRLGRVAATVEPELVYVAGWLERAEGTGGEVLFLDHYGRSTSVISTYRPIGEAETLRWEGFARWLPADGNREAGPGTAYVQLGRDGRRVALGTSPRAREQIARIAAAAGGGPSPQR